MTIESPGEMEVRLRELRNFEECVLEELRWCHFGTVIELVFDYIWQDDGSVRPEYVGPKFRTIVLQNVQEIHIDNALTEYMMFHPNELNWGASEVAAVRLVNESRNLLKYRSVALPLHHLRCEWEGERRIDVIFATMVIR
jgi:hypothetical protein